MTERERNNIPMQAQFLREVFDAHGEIFDTLDARNRNLTFSYWDSTTASYEDVARTYKISGSRARSIVVSTMAKIWHQSPPDVQNRYPLEQLISAKRRQQK